MAEQNVRYDDVVHAMANSGLPVCDDATMPACAPEITTDSVTCSWCQSLIG
jgi:hypothetical protein